jgi:hypothetical protein
MKTGDSGSFDMTLYVLRDSNGWYLGRSGFMVKDLKVAKTFSGLGPAKVSRGTWKRRMGGSLLKIVELHVTEGAVVE